MKKRIQLILNLSFLLVPFCAFSQLSFDFENATTSGTSVTQTINQAGFTYILTASHNSGTASLYNDNGNNLFYASNPNSTPETWTVSLTRDGDALDFRLVGVDYKEFCSTTPLFEIKNNSGMTISTKTIGSLSAGDFSIDSANATNIRSFTISSSTVRSTECVDFDNIVLLPKISSSINETELNKIEFYPNPVSTTITLMNKTLKLENIKLIDLSGKLVKEISANTNVIDVSDLSDGIYFIQLINEDQIVTKKIIKH